MTKAQEAAKRAEAIAADNSHGYLWGGWGPDYDCGHLVIDCYETAGIPVKTKGASYTGNMKRVFLTCGFKDVTGKVNLKTGAGMKAGDVLLNERAHAAMFTGNGKLVQARSNFDGKAGDGSGQEIREQAYYNYPWDCVLRFEETPAEEIPVDEGKDSSSTIIEGLPTLKRGDRSETVRAAQFLLNGRDASVGIWGADGDFGAATKSAVLAFQRRNRLDADGIIGPSTWAKLLGVS